MYDFSYTFSSNFISALISAAVVFVIPRCISVEQYGYYQLYLFYTNYVGVSFFGWCDGIYLRAGGQYYDRLDKSLYCTQFWLLFLYELLFYIVICVIALQTVDEADRGFVIVCVCLVAMGMCLRWFITFVLQATARLKEYAVVVITEKVLFLLTAIPVALLGYHRFDLIVVLDVVAKYMSLFVGVWYCRDLVFAKITLSMKVVSEIWANIRAGLKLMMATLCSMLIIGVVRFGVETYWDIATFSKVSLTLNISNLFLVAINATSVVVYPMLRRSSEKHLPRMYGLMRILLMGLILGALVLYYPIQRLLSVWLPQYMVSLRYAAILLPICVYESKMSMLINTYYKALRLENLLMKCNMAALALSAALTLVATVVFHDVTFAILSILITLVFRGIISELLLSKHIDIKVKKDIVIELAMTVAFIVCNWFFGFAGMVMYAGCYALYLIIKKSDIMETVSFIKSMR